MKILLVEADFVRGVGSRKDFFAKPSAPTLGVNYLASILRNYQHEVIVLDSLYECLRTDFSSPVDIEKGTKTILEKEKDIECVGISMTSPTRNYALRIARQVRAYNPEIKVIGGGPHVTVMQEMFLDKFSHLLDFLVVGEGDKTLPELITALGSKEALTKVAGVIYVDLQGKTRSTGLRPILSEEEMNNVSVAPFTDYTQYQNILPHKCVPAVSLLTTRGCPYHCTFCYSPHLWRRYREQSAERVIAEIDHLIRKYSVKNVRFQDDTFTFNKNRCIGILNGIKARKMDIELYMHTRFGCIDEDIIKAYAKAGGRDIHFGLESGSRELRTAMGKNHGITNREILRICRIVKEYGLNLGLWLIFGYPAETDEDIKMTYELVKEIEPDEVICNPAHVHPYTPLFYRAIDEGIYKIEDWLDGRDDFFPYYRGKKGRHNYSTCQFFQQHFSKKAIRTRFEEEYETTLSSGVKGKRHE